MTRRLAIAMVTLLASVASVASVQARPKVFKDVPTRAMISVSGSATAGATAKVVYTSNDPA